MKGQAISGFFISFTDEEKELINQGLAFRGFEEDDDGLKKFLLDFFGREVEEEEIEQERPTSRFINGIGDYIINNPDTINKGINAVQSWLKKAKGG